MSCFYQDHCQSGSEFIASFWVGGFERKTGAQRPNKTSLKTTLRFFVLFRSVAEWNCKLLWSENTKNSLTRGNKRVKRPEGRELVRTGGSKKLFLTSKERHLTSVGFGRGGWQKAARQTRSASWASQLSGLNGRWCGGQRHRWNAAERRARKKDETLINAVHPSQVLKTLVCNYQIFPTVTRISPHAAGRSIYYLSV